MDMAQAQGAEIIDFNAEDPVEALEHLTGGIGPDRAIDAVGVDASRPHSGPAAPHTQQVQQHQQELQQIAPETADNWQVGDAPSQALDWAVQGLAKAGTLSIIGVYPPGDRSFPIGMAMNRNLTLKMGNCNHRSYIPQLVDWVRSGTVTPTEILTKVEPMTSVIDAYKAFDQQQAGWMKVELVPGT